MGDISFGEYLFNTRTEKKMTITELEKKSTVSGGYLSLIENQKKTPSANTIKKLAEALDVDYVEMLIRAGLLEEMNAIHPAILNNLQKKTIKIPLLSGISADKDIIHEDHVIDYLQLPKKGHLKEGKTIAIHMPDSSMKDARINDGDLLIVEITDEISDGDIMVMLHKNESPLLIRKVRLAEESTALLFPANDIYDPIITTEDNLYVIGKVAKVLISL
ncbi:S24 family peptidase [Bacillus sp. FSL W7-1360]